MISQNIIQQQSDILLKQNWGDIYTGVGNLTWAYPRKSSDFPEITTTKDYFVIYSTDHASSANGKVKWAEMDDLEFNGFEFRGDIVTGFQSEYPWIIRIPSDVSGVSDTIFLYYHTNSSDPSNTIPQETKLITSSGGLLHLATWTKYDNVLGVESGDNHTGYLRLFKRGYSDYIGDHLNKSGLPISDKQSWSTSSNGINFTRGGKFFETDGMPLPSGQFRREDGLSFIWRGIPYAFINYTKEDRLIPNVKKYLAIATLDSSSYVPNSLLQIITELPTVNSSSPYDEDIYAYIDLNNIAWIYFRVTNLGNDTLKLYQYDLNNI
jgi:hypothetical protein